MNCACTNDALCAWHATRFQRYLKEEVPGLLKRWDEEFHRRVAAEKEAERLREKVVDLEEAVERERDNTIIGVRLDEPHRG